MIIPDLSEISIIASIKNYIDESHVNERKNRINSMNYYEGVNLEEETRKWFDTNALQYAPPMAINITKKLIDARFISYKAAHLLDFNIFSSFKHYTAYKVHVPRYEHNEIINIVAKL